MSGLTYPVLTVFQPWASLIAEQLKPLEFRSRKPPAKYVGRRIAIHASARKVVVAEVRQPDMEADLRWNAEREISRRSGLQA